RCRALRDFLRSCSSGEARTRSFRCTARPSFAKDCGPTHSRSRRGAATSRCASVRTRSTARSRLSWRRPPARAPEPGAREAAVIRHLRRGFSVLSTCWLLFLLVPLSSTGLAFAFFLVSFAITVLLLAVSLLIE